MNEKKIKNMLGSALAEHTSHAVCTKLISVFQAPLQVVEVSPALNGNLQKR